MQYVEVVKRVQCKNCLHLDYDAFKQPLCDLDNLDMDPEEERICRQFCYNPAKLKTRKIELEKPKHKCEHQPKQKPALKPKPELTTEPVKTEIAPIAPKYAREKDHSIEISTLQKKLFRKEINVSTFKSEMEKLNLSSEVIERRLGVVIKYWEELHANYEDVLK